MKALLAVFILFLLTDVSAQQTSGIRVTKESKGVDFDFPIISNQNKLIEDKINIYLQLAQLALLKGKQKNNIFEVVSKDPGTIYGGKVSIQYDILSNSDKNFALKFIEASCGATCAYWVRYYNFNPKNGDRYSLSDFFDKVQFAIFKKQVISIRKKKIKLQTQKLRKTGENLNYLENYLYSEVEEDDLEDFHFDKDSIYFDNENLVHKNDKTWDIDHTSSIAIKSIKNLLNKHGRAALITNQNLSSHRSSVEPQLYEGVINNKLEFYFLFKNYYKNNFKGTYAYKKHGKAIDLEGELIGNSFVFKEKDSDFKDIASISFTKKGTTLNGFWENKKGSKFTFKAKRK